MIFHKIKPVHLSALLGSASANGFQMVVTGSQAKSLNDFQVVNLQVNNVNWNITVHSSTVCTHNLIEFAFIWIDLCIQWTTMEK